ncbi:MAG: murein biosynthesis integral membrane protein MurJ [FCB group bacterium]|nr:murein biosynthesis integral membrane protein MurJ [FCB group bacterium]
MGNNVDSIKEATIGIALLVLISKGFGFVREMVIAYKFGTGIEYDVYLIAASIPIALFAWFGATFSSMFIPGYVQALSDRDRSRAWKALWTDYNLALIISVVAVLALLASASQIIRAIAPGLDEKYLSEAVYMTRVSAIIAVLAVLEAIFRSVLNAEKKFMVPAAGPVLFNLVIIGSVVGLSGSLSVRAILYGLVFGYAAQVLFTYIPFRRFEISRHFNLRFNRERIRPFFAAAVAILIIEGAAHLYGIVDRYFASSMESGIISTLGYSYNLMMLPIMIFAYALSTALFPYFSDAFTAGDKKRISYLISRGISISLLLALPTTVIIWIFSDKLVILLFRRGAFDMESVRLTAGLLKYFSLGLAAQFILYIMVRAYYAAKKLKPLLFQVGIVVIAKIFLTAWLVGPLGHIGLAVSAIISYCIGALILYICAGSVLTRLDGKGIFLYFIKVVTAAAAALAAGQLLYNRFLADLDQFGPLLFTAVAVIGVTLIVFTAVAYFLNIPDVREIAGFRKRR